MCTLLPSQPVVSGHIVGHYMAPPDAVFFSLQAGNPVFCLIHTGARFLSVCLTAAVGRTIELVTNAYVLGSNTQVDTHRYTHSHTRVRWRVTYTRKHTTPHLAGALLSSPTQAMGACAECVMHSLQCVQRRHALRVCQSAIAIATHRAAGAKIEAAASAVGTHNTHAYTHTCAGNSHAGVACHHTHTHTDTHPAPLSLHTTE